MRATNRLSVIALLAGVCLFSMAAQAQNEFAAEVSGAFPSANNFSIDPSVGFQLNYAHRIVSTPGLGLYVEVPFLAGFNNTRSIPTLFTSQTFSSLFFTPGLKLKFLPGFFISPYVAGGIGFGHFHSSNYGTSETDFAGDIGGGVDIKVFPHLSLRGEVRDFITTTPGIGPIGTLGVPVSGNMNNVITSGGVVLRF
jgi:hypothetical protein